MDGLVAYLHLVQRNDNKKQESRHKILQFTFELFSQGGMRL